MHVESITAGASARCRMWHCADIGQRCLEAKSRSREGGGVQTSWIPGSDRAPEAWRRYGARVSTARHNALGSDRRYLLDVPRRRPLLQLSAGDRRGVAAAVSGDTQGLYALP